MTINPNDPAMPTIESFNHNGIVEIKTDAPGLTIRAEIAARLMHGLLAHYGIQEHYSGLAFDAVKAADALINELNKQT